MFTEKPPRLVWSHHGSTDYLDGIKHVTHNFEGDTFDCLEIAIEGRYLITLQLTIRYTVTEPRTGLTGYVTLTNFRNNSVFIFAKTSFTIPETGKGEVATMKQPVTMIRSALIQTGDILCVAMSNPELIYISNIDNFFGLVILWKWYSLYVLQRGIVRSRTVQKINIYLHL